MAECLLRHCLGGGKHSVSSAGIAALTGQGMDPLASAVLAAHGIDGGAHRARQFTRELAQQSDLILAMDQSHLASVRATVPEASGKLFLLDKWVSARDIPDPYGRRRSVFEQVYTMIDQGVRGWLPYL